MFVIHYLNLPETNKFRMVSTLYNIVKFILEHIKMQSNKF